MSTETTDYKAKYEELVQRYNALLMAISDAGLQVQVLAFNSRLKE